MNSHIPETETGIAAPSVNSPPPKEPVVPRPMRLTDVPTAVRSKENAFEKDPLRHWNRDTPDFHDSLFYRQSRRADAYAGWTQFVTGGWAFTVDDGGAAVGYYPAKKTWSLFDKSLTTATGGILGFGYLVTFTSQQKQRLKELKEKAEKAVNEAFGDRKDDMVYLHILCTDPAKQGRGYASALVREVTKIADEQRRATYLISSNVANTGFYNSVGFVEKARIVLGEDDATWNEDPLVLLVMARELPDSA